MQRRLIPLTRDPEGQLQQELASVQTVFVHGISPMSYKELRSYLCALDPTLTSKSIPCILYFGRVTCFLCHSSNSAAALRAALSDFGGRIAPTYSPWLPSRRADHDNAAIVARCVTLFCKRIAYEIRTSPNLLVSTFLQRRLAPHLSERISSLVHPAVGARPLAGTSHPPQQEPDPPPPGLAQPSLAPPDPVQSAQAEPTRPLHGPPDPAVGETATPGPTPMSVVQSSAALAASTSAPALVSVVAGGTK
jgi:hypothetical protein